ncbi:MAG: glycosyltransferase family 2 protein [Proteobacteria bacterium]|nr:glycosyltransferase family 2 protein [Pseudomonadota bacterium]
MPRVGQNPLKKLDRRFEAQEVSVCTLVYIPQLDGYWEQSFDVLKLCLGSLRAHTATPFDLVVLDNGSCAEVREYLLELHAEGVISLLLLAAENLGKTGAWNVLFPACPGRYLAFMDSDVYFSPGWLERSLEVLRAFENVGMVTGRPSRTASIHREAQLSATLRYAETGAGVTVERGDLVPRAVLDEHARSLGTHGDPAFQERDYEDVRLTRAGVAAYAYAGHFQFVVPKEVALAVLPLEGRQALAGDEREWDARVNRLGKLRLSLTDPLVRHIGNTMSADDRAALAVLSQAGAGAAGATGSGSGPKRAARPSDFVTRQLRVLARHRRVRSLLQLGYARLFDVLNG